MSRSPVYGWWRTAQLQLEEVDLDGWQRVVDDVIGRIRDDEALAHLEDKDLVDYEPPTEVELETLKCLQELRRGRLPLPGAVS